MKKYAYIISFFTKLNSRELSMTMLTVDMLPS